MDSNGHGNGNSASFNIGQHSAAKGPTGIDLNSLANEDEMLDPSQLPHLDAT